MKFRKLMVNVVFVKKMIHKNGNVYKCEICHQMCHFDCVGLTACQTNLCQCRNCFDYKCTKCGEENLEYGEIYLTDDDPTPICDKCRNDQKDSDSESL